MAKAIALAKQIEDLFPEATAKSAEDRMHSQGKLRGGENDALLAVLAGVDYAPAAFASLADKDQGHDDKRVETDLLGDRLSRLSLYTKAGSELLRVATLLDDTALTTGEQVKPITLAAYAIAKPIAENDKKMRSAISKALEFYGRIGKAGAKTKMKRQPKG